MTSDIFNVEEAAVSKFRYERHLIATCDAYLPFDDFFIRKVSHLAKIKMMHQVRKKYVKRSQRLRDQVFC